MSRPTVYLIQGIYYLITGIWPLVSINTFMAVTGLKIDVWLLKMVGLLTASIALTIITSRRSSFPGIKTLALCSAASYLLIDIYYYFAGVIGAVYLADAAVELAISTLLFFSKKSGRT